MGSEQSCVHASGEDLDEAGRAIRTCLEASSLDVAPPRSFSGVFDPVLELAEARSYNAFVKSAKCCEIELQDEVMTFLPTRNEGAEEGFVPLGTKVDVPSLSDREVGAAAIKALSISE